MRKRRDAIYISTRRPAVKKKAGGGRNIPYPGQPVLEYQYNKLERCWYCGVINTVGREDEDNGNSTMSSTLSDQTVQSQGYHSGRQKAAVSVKRDVFGYRSAPVAGADGMPRTIKNVVSPIAYRGCTGCGTINWRNKH